MTVQRHIFEMPQKYGPLELLRLGLLPGRLSHSPSPLRPAPGPGLCPRDLRCSTWHSPSPEDCRCGPLAATSPAEAREASGARTPVCRVQAKWLFSSEGGTEAGTGQIFLWGTLAAQPGLAWCHWALVLTALPTTGLHDTEFCFSFGLRLLQAAEKVADFLFFFLFSSLKACTGPVVP